MLAVGHCVRLLLFFALLLVPIQPARATLTDTSVLRDRLTADGILKHLRALQTIADAHDGNRAAGTSGYAASVEYVRQTLATAGYAVSVQEFPFVYYNVEVQEGRTLQRSVLDLAPRAMMYSPSTPPDGLRGRLAIVAAADDAALGCAASDFANQDYTNTIVVIKRGTCPFGQKARNARDAGAAAALIYNNVAEPDAPVAGTLGGPDQATIPAAGISRAVGEALVAQVVASSSTINIVLNLQTTTETRTTSNVIAETPRGDADRVVIAGAHLDSVLEGAGINDNGSGVATLLEIAVQMARLKVTTDHQLRFAFWAGEELGLLGSQHYVDQLSPAERETVALYLNFDMVGSPNYARFVYADATTRFDLSAGAQTVEQVFGDYFAAQQLEIDTIPVGDRSDHGPFVAAGIPVGGLFTGAEGTKSESQAATYGGTSASAYDACYHAACDNLSNLNRAALEEMGDAAAHAILTFAEPRSLRQAPTQLAGNIGDSRDCGRLPVFRDRAIPC